MSLFLKKIPGGKQIATIYPENEPVYMSKSQKDVDFETGKINDPDKIQGGTNKLKIFSEKQHFFQH